MRKRRKPSDDMKFLKKRLIGNDSRGNTKYIRQKVMHANKKKPDNK